MVDGELLNPSSQCWEFWQSGHSRFSLLMLDKRHSSSHESKFDSLFLLHDTSCFKRRGKWSWMNHEDRNWTERQNSWQLIGEAYKKRALFCPTPWMQSSVLSYSMEQDRMKLCILNQLPGILSFSLISAFTVCSTSSPPPLPPLKTWSVM